MFGCYEFCKFSDMHVSVAIAGEERWVCFTEQEEEVDSAENNEFFSIVENMFRNSFKISKINDCFLFLLIQFIIIHFSLFILFSQFQIPISHLHACFDY